MPASSLLSRFSPHQRFPADFDNSAACSIARAAAYSFRGRFGTNATGNSLELHVREIFIEEGLHSMQDFQHKPFTEGDKRPDFLFPSQAAYEDPNFPASRLKMLAAKTTCKDRWRQIIREADRIPKKHLLTLQEGVSEGQFREMTGAGVQLVVPAGLHKAFPNSVRPHLMSFESFIADVRLLAI